MGLSHQKQPYPMAGIHALHGITAIFLWQAWDLWYKEQTTCVLLLNFRTFMETPFALNSLPLRQRARWRVRSQVSWRKTCKASALYTIGPTLVHKSSESDSIASTWIHAIRHARCQKLFLFPLSVAKQKQPNFFAKNGSGCIIMLWKLQKLYKKIIAYLRWIIN